MTKRTALAAALGAAAAAWPARSQVTTTSAPAPSDAGAIASHISGRVRLALDGSVQVYFYFLYVDSLGADLFNGTPGERTAHFTLRTDLLTPTITLNGDLAHLGFRPAAGSEGLYRLFYNATPVDRDFARPDSFAQGIEIATFRTRRTQATVIPGAAGLASGTADLASSTTFTFRDAQLNVADWHKAITFQFHIKPFALGDVGVTALSLPMAGQLIKVG